MKILIGISYYYPNVSGLTFYVERLAKGLLKKGHDVCVLTSQYDRSFPSEDVINGVEVRRSFVLFKIGKGVFMPFLPFEIFALARKADVINCHLPQFESFIFAIIGKLLGKKVVFTHHTDLSGWGGLFNMVSESILWSGQLLASLFADKIIPYTKDYADNSWYLKLFKLKLEFILPPIVTGKVDQILKKKWIKEVGKVGYSIGFAGRIAKQKGIPYLLKAIPYLKENFSSDFKIVFAGPYKRIIGENYFDEIENLINQYRDYLYFLGDIPEEKMATFYSMSDVLVLPSDDRLESFGLVQVEAMFNGCPVVATDLPGARIPVKVTGMGLIIPPRNPEIIAKAIERIVRNKKDFVKPKSKIEKIFNYGDTIKKYEKVFKN